MSRLTLVDVLVVLALVALLVWTASHEFDHYAGRSRTPTTATAEHGQ